MTRTYLASTEHYSGLSLTCNGYRVTTCRSRCIQHHCQPSHQLYTGQPPAKELKAVEVAVVSHKHSMLTVTAPQLPGEAAATFRTEIAVQGCTECQQMCYRCCGVWTLSDRLHGGLTAFQLPAVAAVTVAPGTKHDL